MATWPLYAKFITDGFTEDDSDPSVLRTEMDRGVPKQRIVNSDVMQKIVGVILFTNREDIDLFDTWYFETIKRIDWFDIPHPRTGKITRMRIVGGKRGPLTPTASFFHVAQRGPIELEYMN